MTSTESSSCGPCGSQKTLAAPRWARLQRHALKMSRVHIHGKALGSTSEPVAALFALLVACIGSEARTILLGERGPHRLLHVNDYNLDKTFTYAIILLSKILGQDPFPGGFFDQWPPRCPAAAHSLAGPLANIEPSFRVEYASSSCGVP